MQKTIEVEVTEIQEEELTVCDECSRELDPDGKTFAEVESFGPPATQKIAGDRIDLCSECLPNFGVEPENVLTKEEWWGQTDSTGATIRSNLWWMGIATMAFGLAAWIVVSTASKPLAAAIGVLFVFALACVHNYFILKKCQKTMTD